MILGHVLGLPSRRYNVEESLGKHCIGKCVMRQGLKVPYDWIRMSEDRLEYGALCGDCYLDLNRINR